MLLNYLGLLFISAPLHAYSDDYTLTRALDSLATHKAQFHCTSSNTSMRDLSIYLPMTNNTTPVNQAVVVADYQDMMGSYENVRWSDNGTSYEGNAIAGSSPLKIRIDKTTYTGVFNNEDLKCTRVGEERPVSKNNTPTKVVPNVAWRCLNADGEKFSMHVEFVGIGQPSDNSSVLIINESSVVTKLKLNSETMSVTGALTGRFINSPDDNGLLGEIVTGGATFSVSCPRQ